MRKIIIEIETDNEIPFEVLKEDIDRELSCCTYYGHFETVEISEKEVVRCKDCKWFEREQPGMVYCPNIVGSWVEDDFFCKWGERRER